MTAKDVTVRFENPSPRAVLVARMAAYLYDHGAGRQPGVAIELAEDLLERAERRVGRSRLQSKWDMPQLPGNTTAVPCGSDNSTARPPQPVDVPHPMGQLDPHCCRGRDQPEHPLDRHLREWKGEGSC